jgi:hypothetical protein
MRLLAGLLPCQSWRQPVLRCYRLTGRCVCWWNAAFCVAALAEGDSATSNDDDDEPVGPLPTSVHVRKSSVAGGKVSMTASMQQQQQTFVVLVGCGPCAVCYYCSASCLLL